jgi:hypothetical protein
LLLEVKDGMNPSRRLHTSAHHVRFVRAKEGEWTSEVQQPRARARHKGTACQEFGLDDADWVGLKSQQAFVMLDADPQIDAAEAYKEVLSTVKSNPVSKQTEAQTKSPTGHNARKNAHKQQHKAPAQPNKPATDRDRANQRRKEMGMLRAAQEGDLSQMIQFLEQARLPFMWRRTTHLQLGSFLV